MSVVVTVTARDGRGDPIRAVVETVGGAVSIVCRKHVFGWEPLYGIRASDGQQVPIPSCFELSAAAQVGLELAQ